MLTQCPRWRDAHAGAMPPPMQRDAFRISAMIGYGIGAVAAALFGAAGYQAMSPTGQWYGRTFAGRPGTSRELALTYDDGPNDLHTQRLLEVLAKHDVRATFFMIGRYVQQRPQIVHEVAAAGHVIGNHTFTHPNLALISALQTRIQLQECRRALQDVIGEHSNLFRPPFGARRPETLHIARALGLDPVMWNVTAFDWKPTTAAKVERNVIRRISGGDVILLHDGSHQGLGADRRHTIESTDRLIRRYKDDGYRFVTVPEMMASGSRESVSAGG
jgi:peptidoglycan/xylan/chitin deacetylase (PgdA/CDA1 family)